MRILVSESADKRTRSYINVEPDFLLKLIENDYGLHEVIDMFNPDKPLRLFFDVDVEGEEHSKIDVLRETLGYLNRYYNTTDNDWTITCANTIEKASYHIFSNLYCVSMRKLRSDAMRIACPYIDTEVYYFSFGSAKDEGSLRLPNQSKGSINKIGGVHRLLCGELENCLVTQTGGLEQIQ